MSAPAEAKPLTPTIERQMEALLWAKRTARDKAEIYEEKGDQEQRDYCYDTEDALSALIKSRTTDLRKRVEELERALARTQCTCTAVQLLAGVRHKTICPGGIAEQALSILSKEGKT